MNNSELEPIPIENLNELIKKTETYQNTLKNPSYIFKDTIFTITFEFNKIFCVRVINNCNGSNIISGEVKQKDPEIQKTLDLANFINKKIMNEIIDSVRKNKDLNYNSNEVKS